MTIDWLHEHPVIAWHLNDSEHLARRSDGMWEQPGSTLPLSFSLRAVKAMGRCVTNEASRGRPRGAPSR
jgi:hypothetical protein